MLKLSETAFANSMAILTASFYLLFLFDQLDCTWNVQVSV